MSSCVQPVVSGSFAKESKFLIRILGNCPELIPYDLNTWAEGCYNSNTIPLGTICVIAGCENRQTETQQLIFTLAKTAPEASLKEERYICLFPLCEHHYKVGSCCLSLRFPLEKVFHLTSR